MQLEHRGGHHVARQQARGVIEEHPGHDRLPARGHHECHDELVRIVEGNHRAALDRGVLAQDRLDLGELDTHAAHLHLSPDAAEVLQDTVPAIAADVAGAVHPRAVGREGIREESLGGELGPPVVPVRQADLAADVGLAGYADRHRLQPIVEDVEVEVGRRSAERYDGRAGLGRHHHVRHAAGLRWAVAVDQAGGVPVVERVAQSRSHRVRHRKRPSAATGSARAAARR